MGSYNSALPVDGSVIDAGELRSQFGALEGEIVTLGQELHLQEQRGLGIDLLSVTVSDPPSQAEVQAVVDKLNELITSLS